MPKGIRRADIGPWSARIAGQWIPWVAVRPPIECDITGTQEVDDIGGVHVRINTQRRDERPNATQGEADGNDEPPRAWFVEAP